MFVRSGRYPTASLLDFPSGPFDQSTASGTYHFGRSVRLGRNATVGPCARCLGMDLICGFFLEEANGDSMQTGSGTNGPTFPFLNSSASPYPTWVRTSVANRLSGTPLLSPCCRERVAEPKYTISVGSFHAIRRGRA